MSRAKTNIISTLAVLAVAAAEGRAAELLEMARRAAAPLTRCEATTSDVASDVIARIWGRRRDLVERGGFRPYVEQSVRNAWRDELRRKRPACFSDAEGHDDDVAPEPIATRAESAEGLAAIDEFRELLTGEDQEVLEHLEAGRHDREIADRMDKTRHWVRGAVQRIRERAQVYFFPGGS